MKTTIDFAKKLGRVKPMHAVNNGPVGGKSSVRGISDAAWFEEAHIPYARNHDASFCSSYGAENTVDVHRIFRDFSADENDPRSYDFRATDRYTKAIVEVGTKPFYRLGASIEHYEKRGTYPPADFAKWARICEHIIRHYNEGWADGFHYGIEYWEIWNEPDCRNADGSNPCWQGTWPEFVAFFSTAACYLKKTFPALKIGGPTLCSPWGDEVNRIVLGGLRERNVPLDFFSYHWYGKRLVDFEDTLAKGRAVAAQYGYGDAELILDEYNYVSGWLGDDWRHSLHTEKNHVGAAFIMSCLIAGQHGPLDMLMYYDARPCGMNGLFTFDTLDPLPLSYGFRMFGKLYEYGTEVAVDGLPAGVYGMAAAGDTGRAALFAYFSEEPDASPVTLSLSPVGLPAGCKARLTLVDATHTGEPIDADPAAVTLAPNSVLFVEYC